MGPRSATPSTFMGPLQTKLLIDDHLLEAVTVTAERPLVERRPDMMVVNVENSALAAGNTALDILERSPGVTLDKDDNISLMGKQGVTVMIDGKQTHLSSTQLADLLRNTDGNTIKSIELITTPSSKYDASGSAGLINIVLKKNRLAGTTGSATLSAGYGWKYKTSTSLNISHKTERVNLFGTLSYINNQGGQDIHINRSFPAAGVTTVFDQLSNLSRENKNITYRTGLEFNSSPRNTVSLQVNGYTGSNTMANDSRTWIGQSQTQIDSNLSAISLAQGNFRSLSFNAYNQFTIDEKGQKLVADVDLSHFDNKRATDYSNTFFLPTSEQMGESLLSRSSTPTVIDIRTAKLDYTLPFNEKSSLEAGVKYSWVQSDNNMQFDDFLNSSWQTNPNRTNHFTYTEQVSAAYASYKNQLGKLGVQAGLRAEYSLTDGNSITTVNRVQRDYIDLFPTLFLSYALSENHQTGLSYSKRINRPNYHHLNPFSYFLDKFTAEQGNPYLQPEYAHAIDVNYSFQSRYHLSVGYNFTDNVIVESMVQDDEAKTSYVSRANMARQNVYYANIHFPVKIMNKWSTTTNINAYYMGFDGIVNDTPIKQGQYAFNFRNTHNVSILPTLNAEATFNYQSALVYSIYNIGDQWNVDLGLSQSLMQKKASLRLSVSDVFNSRIQNINTKHSNLDVFINQKNESRIVRLSFTYNFGNMKNRVTQQESRSDEKNRISIP